MHDTPHRAPLRRGLFTFWLALSEALLAAERRAVAALMTVLCGAILLNVCTRYLGMPIYWIDELAVYAMVWLTFIGASTMTRLRLDFAVTMMTGRLSPRGQAVMQVLSTLTVTLFAIALAMMCWIWFDPAGLARAGFDGRAFAGQSFNFIYTERTQTLNWPTWVLYLILPVFSLSMIIHSVANLLEDCALVPRRSRDLIINAEEAVN